MKAVSCIFTFNNQETLFMLNEYFMDSTGNYFAKVFILFWSDGKNHLAMC